MAENKKPTGKILVTTNQKTQPKLTHTKTVVIKKKSDNSGITFERSVGIFREGGTIKKSQCPSKHKLHESQKCDSQGPCKPIK